MTISKVLTLPTYSPRNQKQRDNYSPRCALKWRQGQLSVSLEQQIKQPHLPSLESEQWLVNCLKHSPMQRLRIDPDLGETSLKLWADACEQANKAIFLRLPAAHKLPKQRSPRSWWLKRLLDWCAAALLLVVLSPVMLGIVCLMRFYSSEPIFLRQWCVGERGKLFRLLKFRTNLMNAQSLEYSENREEKIGQHLHITEVSIYTIGQVSKVDLFSKPYLEVMGNPKSLLHLDPPGITPLGRWMRKYSLDELPQVFNVLRGEMSLIGPRPWTLHEAVRISPEGRQQLNALPGIIGAFQTKARSNLLDLDTVNYCNLEYLISWSLWQDLRILLLNMPKILLNFGAY